MQRNSSLFHTTVLMLLMVAGLSACGEKGTAHSSPTTMPTVGFITVAYQHAALDTELPGRTVAKTLAEVRPQVSGIVLKRLFTEGADVKAGQPLYQIDPATYRATLASSQAALAKARANLASLKLKADRYQQLIGIHAVGQQDYDDTMAAFKAGQAEVSASQAAVDNARINLGYTHVLAPISGRIGKSNVTEGALVTADQATALATIQTLDPVYVDVTRSSAELLQLKRDLASGSIKRAGADAARVKLILEDGSVYPLAGVLQFTDVTVDPSTGSVVLRAIFPNPKHELLPGMFVRAQLVEGIDEQAILVPQNAISHDSKGQAIAMVVNAAGKAEIRVLETSRVINNCWLVTKGLQPGDRLIVDGLQYIRPGMLVKAVPALNTDAGE